MPDLHGEYCRQCRDEGQPPTYADFILWGKFFPPQALGPRCYLHAADLFDVARVDMWAVYDLRPVHEAIDALAQVAGGGGAT